MDSSGQPAELRQVFRPLHLTTKLVDNPSQTTGTLRAVVISRRRPCKHPSSQESPFRENSTERRVSKILTVLQNFASTILIFGKKFFQIFSRARFSRVTSALIASRIRAARFVEHVSRAPSRICLQTGTFPISRASRCHQSPRAAAHDARRDLAPDRASRAAQRNTIAAR